MNPAAVTRAALTVNFSNGGLIPLDPEFNISANNDNEGFDGSKRTLPAATTLAGSSGEFHINKPSEKRQHHKTCPKYGGKTATKRTKKDDKAPQDHELHQEDVEPVPPVDLNRYSCHLGLACFFLNFILLAKMIVAVVIAAQVRGSDKDTRTSLPIAIITMNSIGFFMEFLLLIIGIPLICLKIENRGDAASMLWHRFVAAFLSTCNLSLITGTLIFIFTSTILE